MAPFYPDNPNRANRVRQLAQDIANFQTRLKEDVEATHNGDEAALVILNTIAVNAGYKTLDEYIEAAMKQLTPEDRAAFDKMKTDLERMDKDMGISHTVFSGFFALGVVLHGIRILADFKRMQSILFGMQAVVRSVYHVITGGAVETAEALALWGRATLTAAAEGEEVVAEVAQGLRFLKIGANVLLVVGLVAEAVLLIVDAVQGAEQMEKLQAAIVELCARRFIVKKMQQKANAIRDLRSDIKSIVKSQATYDKWIKAKRMTVEEAAVELKPDMDKVGADLTKRVKAITPQGIWDLLDKQDDDSKIAWKNEDLKLDGILKWIDDHPQEGDSEAVEKNSKL